MNCDSPKSETSLLKSKRDNKYSEKTKKVTTSEIFFSIVTRPMTTDAQLFANIIKDKIST
jgi:hypothetical protein